MDIEDYRALERRGGRQGWLLLFAAALIGLPAFYFGYLTRSGWNVIGMTFVALLIWQRLNLLYQFRRLPPGERSLYRAEICADVGRPKKYLPAHMYLWLKAKCSGDAALASTVCFAALLMAGLALLASTVALALVLLTLWFLVIPAVQEQTRGKAERYRAEANAGHYGAE